MGLEPPDVRGFAMVYMIIEDFHAADPAPVYRRLRERGRQRPEGLRYLASWITQDLSRCYQVMECDDRALLEQWMSRWSDLMSFQIVPVITSEDAIALMEPRL